jgi:2',3'-cyclic-nucleotide 3'-phosphodiesterase
LYLWGSRYGRRKLVIKRAVIMRGLPGSGKTTLAKSLARHYGGALIFNADAYHTVDGEYRYDPAKAGWAHSECLRMFTLSVSAGSEVVIVDNTNTSGLQIAPYVRVAEAFGYEVSIIEMGCSILDSIERNTHDVPEETICRMAMHLSRGLPEGWDKRYSYYRDVSITDTFLEQFIA